MAFKVIANIASEEFFDYKAAEIFNISTLPGTGDFIVFSYKDGSTIQGKILHRTFILDSDESELILLVLEPDI
jgi:hypothetical protein